MAGSGEVDRVLAKGCETAFCVGRLELMRARASSLIGMVAAEEMEAE